jgi:sulfite reductase (NADPH) flavoprotein alpha-component
MHLPPPDPTHSLLSDAQTAQLNALVGSLTTEQLAWTLGYLAGTHRSQANPTESVVVPAPAGAISATTVSPTIRPLTVLYASQTGNAAKVARRLAAAASAAGVPVSVVSAGDYPTGRLRDERQLVLVSSTQGEGDPPDAAVELHRFLWSKRAPRLEGLRFAVLALGDYSYANFCKAGADFDRRLEELGGARVLPRVDCDVEFETPATEWQAQVIAAFRPLLAAEATSASPRVAGPAATPAHAPAASTLAGLCGPPAAVAPVDPEPVYQKGNPFYAPVLDRIVLNGRGSGKQTVHLEISLTGSGVRYQPGDALGVVPRNAPAYVDELIGALGVPPEAPVVVDGRDRPLREVLLGTFEVTSITRPFVKAYAAATKHAELAALLEPGREERFVAYTRGREIVDVVSAYRPGGISGREFIATLRRLQPRLYSIASSLLAHDEEAHLLVGLTRYQSHGRLREGVCSGYLCARRGEDEPVPIFPSPNPQFRLPPNPDARIIMVGPGTGVAPFRAFVEERAALGSRGRNWLFFGDRHFATDFLYQVEWQRWYRAGVLSRMDLAFSRDQPEKIYVQQRMLENARDLYAWLEDGAYLYLCGEAASMAGAVHQALVEIARAQGGKTPEAALEYVERLQAERRYLRDVY